MANLDERQALLLRLRRLYGGGWRDIDVPPAHFPQPSFSRQLFAAPRVRQKLPLAS